MKLSCFRTIGLAGLAVLLSAPPSAFSQSDLSTVTGTIHDASGGTVPKAKVTLRNQSNNVERSAQTNEGGNYTITSVPAGTYELIVTADGFKTYEQTNNPIVSNLTATIDATLQLGAVKETVQVTAEAPPLQADSATLGREISEKQIKDLQLNGRNPYFLALLKPGVQGAALGGFSFGLTNSLSMNGGRNQDALITQDGAVAVRTRSNGTSIGVADADSTQEVQILTANYNAEYGRASGGQIRIVTKSGGRDFHGTIYEYLRNSALDANSWLRNNQPDPTINSQAAPFRFNQFGYNISGPVFIPKVWNRNRNKMFFIFGQEFVRHRPTDTNQTTVPSLAMRRGDFSELLSANNGFYSGARVLTIPGTSTPLPNNVIPQNLLSANGLALLNTYPLPNRGSGQNNAFYTASHPTDTRKDSAGLDFYPGDKHFVKFRVLNYNYSEYIPFASNLPVIPQTFKRPNQTVSLNYIWSASPTFVNQLLVTASRDQVYINIDETNGLWDRTRYGINYPYLFPTGKQIQNKIPTITLNSPFTELSGLPYPSQSTGPIYDVSDTITKIIGNHQIKAGFLWERAGQNDFDQINVSGVPGGTNNQNGRFVFNDTRQGGSGLAVANAAFGLFDTYAELGTRSYTPYRGNMYEWFVQDSWKASSKLHIDYGLRQSIIVPYYSIWRNMSVFDPRFYDPAKAVQVDPRTGNPIPGTGDPYNGLVIPGSGFPDSAQGRVAADNGQFDYLFRGVGKSYSQTHPIQGLQPRVGLAYALNDKTVFRAAAGRFLTRLGVSDSVFLGGNPPFQPSAAVSRGSVDNPGGVGQTAFPLPVTTQDPIFMNPEAWTWNAAIQRQLPASMTIEIAYVGRRGLHTQQELNLNALAPGSLIANPNTDANYLRPYKGYGTIRSTNNVGTSLYNALQIDLNRRFTNGLLFGLAYTWSKSTDNGSAQRDVLPDYSTRAMMYGYSSFDRRHLAVFNVIYELPFFKDKSTLKGKLLGGWQISEVTQFQTGTPVSVESQDDIAGVGSSGTGNNGSTNGGFNTRWLINDKIPQTAQFANVTRVGSSSYENKFYYPFVVGQNILRPAPGTFSTQLSRNIFFQPGFQNWNLGVFKSFNVTESQYATFRFEVFNWLNHPNWGDINSGTGGGLNTNPTSALFGKITGKGSQRQLQLSLRYTF
jgi:hypothetical protein